MHSFGRAARLLVTASLLLVTVSCTGSAGPGGAGGGVPIEVALGQYQSDTEVLASETSAGCIAEGVPATQTHQAMLEAVNSYRILNGLRPLGYSKRLELAANEHAQDLWARSFFDHVNPDGQDPSDRALDAGFCHQYVGENIAAGQRSASAAMQAWIESPPHNANLLEPDFAYVGMGYFVDPNGRHYWGQLFAFEYP